MSQEERAKWSSVLCAREVGRHGEVLSVELLRWAWRRLKQCRPGAPVDAGSMAEAVQVGQEELIPFGKLLGAEQGLEPICSAAQLAFAGLLELVDLDSRRWMRCSASEGSSSCGSACGTPTLELLSSWYSSYWSITIGSCSAWGCGSAASSWMRTRRGTSCASGSWRALRCF